MRSVPACASMFATGVLMSERYMREKRSGTWEEEGEREEEEEERQEEEKERVGDWEAKR